MKILLSITLSLFLLTVPASAGEVKMLPEGTTVNDLLEQGYRLFSTDTMGYSVPTGDGYGSNKRGVFYHLIKGKELVTCVLSKLEVACLKP